MNNQILIQHKNNTWRLTGINLEMNAGGRRSVARKYLNHLFGTKLQIPNERFTVIEPRLSKASQNDLTEITGVWIHIAAEEIPVFVQAYRNRKNPNNLKLIPISEIGDYSIAKAEMDALMIDKIAC